MTIRFGRVGVGETGVCGGVQVGNTTGCWLLLEVRVFVATTDRDVARTRQTRRGHRVLHLQIVNTGVVY